jgi:hypothetical protein
MGRAEARLDRRALGQRECRHGLHLARTRRRRQAAAIHSRTACRVAKVSEFGRHDGSGKHCLSRRDASRELLWRRAGNEEEKGRCH